MKEKYQMLVIQLSKHIYFAWDWRDLLHLGFFIREPAYKFVLLGFTLAYQRDYPCNY